MPSSNMSSSNSSSIMSFGKARRVTYPFDGHAISRLLVPSTDSTTTGTASRSSQDDDDSPFNCDLIDGFFLDNADDDGSSTTEPSSSESDFDRVDSVQWDSIEKLLRRCSVSGCSEVDSYLELLSSHVDRAMKVFSQTEPNKSDRRRKVVLLLQEIGHNAALCNTKWDHGRGITAGNHEFIDVVGSGGQRYIVELDLAGQFEIARPTRQYSRLMQSVLPGVFVGKSEELKMIVKAMTEAAKISLQSRGLTVPPWRKSCFMKNKWFGPYRRTMNEDVAVCSVNAAVKCRSVGFDNSSGGAAVVRTR